jgi:phosphatidylinositol-4,5-bisphosphate 3-kinase
LIGKQLNKYDYIQDPEVAAFRRSILQVCRDAVDARKNRGRDGAAEHRFPPNVVVTPFPQHLSKKLMKGDRFMVIVCLGAEVESKYVYSLPSFGLGS